MRASRTIWRQLRVHATRALRLILLAAGPLPAALLAAGLSAAHAQAVKGEMKVATDNGFARIVVTLAEEVESNVRVSGGIIVISFKQPVDVEVDRINASAPTYISASRRDPDGKAIRIALARKLTVNSMAASERLFVDLLPDTWNSLPPGLPKEVIEELTRRAREAEKILRQQRVAGQPKPQPPIRVRVATQPTFTRYVFELPPSTSVASEREKDQLTLTFPAPLKFDLADAKATLPQVISSIDQDIAQDSTAVRFLLKDAADIRTFREDNSYLVDVGAVDAKDTRKGASIKPSDVAATMFDGAAKAAPIAGMEPPPTVPAKLSGGNRPPSGGDRPPSGGDKPSEKAAEKTVPTPPARPATAPGKPARSTAPPAAAPDAAAKSSAAPKSGPRLAAAPPKPPAVESPKPEMPAQAAPASKLAAVAPVEQPKPVAPAQPAPPQAAVDVPVAPLEDIKPAAPALAEPKPVAETIAPEKVASEKAIPEIAAPERAAPATKEAEPPRPDNRSGSSVVELRRQGENLKLVFPFQAPVPAAMFRRADTLWLVFDTPTKIEVGALSNDASRTVRTATTTTMGDAQVVRLQLERPRLMSVATEADNWLVTIGDTVADPSRPLGIARNIVGPSRASITIPFEEPRRIHRLLDPDIGDTLLVVSALGPARGFLKTQDFVELRALASSHGVIVQPLADDLAVELSADKVLIAKPGGLTLSGATMATKNSAAYRPLVFDAQNWGFDRQANFNERQFKLLNAAADAPESRRLGPRLDLARFYLARELFTEAKGVLDVALGDDRATAEDPSALVLHAIANIMLDRPEQALKELANPIVGNQHDAPLWRALAYARQGRWPEAREGFRGVETAMGTLPAELQRLVLKQALRASIEVRDFAGASAMLNELETVGIPREMEAELSVLIGRVAQGLGRMQDALSSYRAAADSPHRPAASQGRLRETVLRYELGDLKPDDVINELETLTALWRGDETEIAALQWLARLYTQAERYRDAFHVMRTALRAHPNSEMTRKIQDEAAATFDTLFLAGKGDALPAIDALSLFYDFRELTPIGRRGDEMIRRLADRLVSVDLLTQAAELLQHQVDHRLQGAGRAQVATRLAVIYLMNRKPERAQATLKSTRVAELSVDLRNLRLMLEARALSDIGRHDVALEIIADMDRREAIRLRADILWVAKRFQEAAEQIELMHGERWREWEPLKDPERADILRAAIGFALSEDTIGVARLREKYAAKMAEGSDRRAFDIATAPLGVGPAEFREIAKTVAGLDTLEGFLRDLRARYPEIGALSPLAAVMPATDAPQKIAKTDAPPGRPQPVTTR